MLSPIGARVLLERCLLQAHGCAPTYALADPR